MYVCMHAIYVCMQVCLYACMRACMCIYICVERRSIHLIKMWRTRQETRHMRPWAMALRVGTEWKRTGGWRRRRMTMTTMRLQSQTQRNFTTRPFSAPARQKSSLQSNHYPSNLCLRTAASTTKEEEERKGGGEEVGSTSLMTRAQRQLEQTLTCRGCAQGRTVRGERSARRGFITMGPASRPNTMLTLWRNRYWDGRHARVEGLGSGVRLCGVAGTDAGSVGGIRVLCARVHV
jgi:hypothetical protein